MSRYFTAFLKTLSLIAGLLVLYTVFRTCFFLFNRTVFSDLSSGELFALLWHGLRFDLSAILALNALVLLLLLLPFDTLRYRKLQQTTGVLFVVFNSLAALFELADWIYYPFNHKRSTADVLDMVSRKGDFITLLPDFLRLYWYLFLLAALLVFLLARFYRFADRKFDRLHQQLPPVPANAKTFLLRSGIFLLASGLCLVGIRGGFQFIPINIRNAIEVSPPQYTSIVLNTPFSIINSWQGDRLEPLHFMPEAEANALVQPIKKYGDNRSFQKKNVVVIIVESLSKEFTKLGGVKSYTPFLDSLMDHGLTFTNAFANALHSNEGIPALVAGLPGLMEEPITTSVYSNNHFTALPALLDAEGYSTAFYHGATNGSMSFDIFAKEAGFQHYYGRTEYHNDADYDGSWGIYDEPFLQYFAAGMNRMQQPFMTTVFTVTSHHPFPLPQQYRNRFPKGTIPMQESMGYTDYALRRFFETARQMPWFRNTVFVITADHCSPYASNDYYSSGTGRYQIPILLYAPGDTATRGFNPVLTQQIDVMPTILDYLGYNKPFFAFGSSALRENGLKFMAARLSGVYQWISDGFQLKITDGKVLEAYRFPTDSLCRQNLADELPELPEAQTAARNWKAFVQTYNNALINNTMSVK